MFQEIFFLLERNLFRLASHGCHVSYKKIRFIWEPIYRVHLSNKKTWRIIQLKERNGRVYNCFNWRKVIILKYRPEQSFVKVNVDAGASIDGSIRIFPYISDIVAESQLISFTY